MDSLSAAKVNAILFSASMLEMPPVETAQEPDRAKWLKQMLQSHVNHGQRRKQQKS